MIYGNLAQRQRWDALCLRLRAEAQAYQAARRAELEKQRKEAEKK